MLEIKNKYTSKEKRRGIYSGFFEKFYGTASRIGAEYFLSPLFILSVAALETGFGKHAPFNNFFGIKASQSSKKPRFSARTKEFMKEKSNAVMIRDYFRAYNSFDDSCRDFCLLITKRYPQCAGVYDSSVCGLLQSNPKRKYATDPEYTGKLEGIYFVLETIKGERGKEERGKRKGKYLLT